MNDQFEDMQQGTITTCIYCQLLHPETQKTCTYCKGQGTRFVAAQMASPDRAHEIVKEAYQQVERARTTKKTNEHYNALINLLETLLTYGNSYFTTEGHSEKKTSTLVQQAIEDVKKQILALEKKKK